MHHSILSFCLSAVALSSVFSLPLFAATATSPASTSKDSTATTQTQANQSQDFPDSALQASAMAAQAWLNLVDSNKYGQSWDESTTLTKLTVKKDEWLEILEKTRRPLGSVTSRQVMDQRTAKDPSGMPKGDYIVMFYKTVFSHKTAYELLTLYLEDGEWHVLTYQVDTK